jgi:ATP-dependent DNA helicase RecQ
MLVNMTSKDFFMIVKAREILKDIFGYDSFYPMQEEIIQAVLGKKDAIVVMPTGGGKSICYQIPALILDGLTVVVSPLISLMKDQVDGLKELGVPACYLSSSITPEEYVENRNNVISGKIKLLYAAPESLMKDNFLAFLQGVNPVLFAIDEAHCISHWGHDFRLEYRQLSKLKNKFPKATVMALTATATRLVREDIKKSLALDPVSEFVAGFNRPNLFMEIKQKSNPFKQTLEFISKFKNQSGIIYCFSRKQVDELCFNLTKNGFSALPYHAGLDDRTRNENQESFIRDKTDIIVATIAFGMGINKPDVRFVLHYDLPRNIESYYQEIGRAGRDGLPAHCLLLYNFSDTRKIQYFIDEKEDPGQRQVAVKQLGDMVKLAESGLCRRYMMITYFGENYTAQKCGNCDNCVGNDDESRKTDVTRFALKVFETMRLTGFKFGTGHIINIIRGSGDRKIIQYSHNNLKTYGSGKEKSKEFWQKVIAVLLKEGYVSKDIDNYGILKFTGKIKEVLNNSGFKIYCSIGPEEKHEAGNNKKYDTELYDILRKVRKDIAAFHNVPPYIIFTDVTLVEMATYFPRTKEDLLKINGVGSVKLEKYGDNFLIEILRYLDRNPEKTGMPGKISVQKTGNIPKHIITSNLFNEGKSVEQISEEFGIVYGTIIDHFFKFISEGNRIDQERLVSHLKIDGSKLEVVLKIYDSIGCMKLKPVFDQLDGSVGYDDLKIARIIFLGRQYAENI